MATGLRHSCRTIRLATLTGYGCSGKNLSCVRCSAVCLGPCWARTRDLAGTLVTNKNTAAIVKVGREIPASDVLGSRVDGRTLHLRAGGDRAPGARGAHPPPGKSARPGAARHRQCAPAAAAPAPQAAWWWRPPRVACVGGASAPGSRFAPQNLRRVRPQARAEATGAPCASAQPTRSTRHGRVPLTSCPSEGRRPPASRRMTWGDVPWPIAPVALAGAAPKPAAGKLRRPGRFVATPLNVRVIAGLVGRWPP